MQNGRVYTSRALGRWIVAATFAAASPLVGVAQEASPGPGEGLEPPGSSTPSPPPKEQRRVIVTGEIEMTPNATTGESDVLSLRTPGGNLILESETATDTRNLEGFVGSTVEVTGQIRFDAIEGGIVLTVENYRPIERVQEPTQDDQRPSEPRDEEGIDHGPTTLPPL